MSFGITQQYKAPTHNQRTAAARVVFDVMLFVSAHFAVLATARPIATTASHQHQQKDTP